MIVFPVETIRLITSSYSKHLIRKREKLSVSTKENRSEKEFYVIPIHKLREKWKERLVWSPPSTSVFSFPSLGKAWYPGLIVLILLQLVLFCFYTLIQEVACRSQFLDTYKRTNYQLMVWIRENRATDSLQPISRESNANSVAQMVVYHNKRG